MSYTYAPDFPFPDSNGHDPRTCDKKLWCRRRRAKPVETSWTAVQQTWNWVIGSAGQWVIWVIFHGVCISVVCLFKCCCYVENKLSVTAFCQGWHRTAWKVTNTHVQYAATQIVMDNYRNVACSRVQRNFRSWSWSSSMLDRTRPVGNPGCARISETLELKPRSYRTNWTGPKLVDLVTPSSQGTQESHAQSPSSRHIDLLVYSDCYRHYM